MFCRRATSLAIFYRDHAKTARKISISICFCSDRTIVASFASHFYSSPKQLFLESVSKRSCRPKFRIGTTVASHEFGGSKTRTGCSPRKQRLSLAVPSVRSNVVQKLRKMPPKVERKSLFFGGASRSISVAWVSLRLKRQNGQRGG